MGWKSTPHSNSRAQHINKEEQLSKSIHAVSIMPTDDCQDMYRTVCGHDR
jgi:hypothetical protein